MKTWVLITLFLSGCIVANAQDSCFLFPVRIYNVIQNPSFELDPGQSCTSGYIDQYGLTIPYWTTATNEMLTGYLNACSGFKVPDSTVIKASKTNRFIFLYPTVPQPIPDGKAVVAVTDFGFNGQPYAYSKHTSYVSTCLPETMTKDSLYRLEFYVGFGTRTDTALVTDTLTLMPELSPSPEKFSLFGLTVCPSYPLPIVGCPRVGGWVVLGSCKVSGDLGTWVKTKIDFRLPIDVQAIALGPTCDTTPVSPQGIYKYADTLVHSSNYSYFLDNLQMYKGSVPFPFIKIASGSFCNKSVTLQAAPFYYDSGAVNVQWFKDGNLLVNEHNPTLVVNANSYGEGYYRVMVSNDSICLASDLFPVEWENEPQASVLGSPDTTACIGDSVLLNAFTDTLSTYTWQDGSTLPYFLAGANGTYSVTITNSCGTTQAQKKIQFEKCKNEIYVPNAFTPNGDGINDVFRIRYSNPPVKFKMNIYNRYGQLIFSSFNPSTGWDGTINGVKQPIDTYVWMIEFTDQKGIEHERRGTVVLIK
ncbi:MAG TPA: gliding motility-associated C-terminal domain-containing protein [Puia sp.]|nr:gliding motility-associated C-terminal domain-containing protein [Puia sp.]